MHGYVRGLKGVVGAPWNWFKPSSKIILLTVPMQYFYCGSLGWLQFQIILLQSWENASNSLQMFLKSYWEDDTVKPVLSSNFK